MRSPFFRFAVAVMAYLLFILKWVLMRKAVWYNQLPAETEYFSKPVIQFYYTYLYIIIGLFVLFLVLNIASFIIRAVSKLVKIATITVLIISVCWFLYFVKQLVGFHTYEFVPLILLLYFSSIVLFILYAKETANAT